MSKTILRWLLLIVSVFFIYIWNSTFAVETNLILNPSVETSSWNLPINWLKQTIWKNTTVFSYLWNGQEGIHSLNITVSKYTRGQSDWYFTPITVKPNNSYKYSEYYKSTVSTEIYLRVTKINWNVSNTLLWTVPASVWWVKFEKDFITPKNTSKITVVHMIKSNGSLTTDNFSLTDNTPPPPPPPSWDNLIPNPSVEIPVPTNLGLPQSWNSSKDSRTDAVFYYLNTGYTWSKSLKVDVRSISSSWYAYYYFDPQNIEEGKTYEYSVKYKSNVSTEVDMAINFADGTTKYYYVWAVSPSTDWATYKTTIVMPAWAVSITIYSLLYTVGNLTTDDYLLKPVTIQWFNKAIVTLTFDDYLSQSFYDTAYQSFKNHNMAGTMYPVSSYITDPYFPKMSKEHFIEMVNYGIEIGSHTVSHPHLPEITQALVDYELTESKKAIEQYIWSPIVSFASPYWEYNDSVLSQIKNYYESHRTVEEWYNSKNYFDQYRIKAMNATSSTTPEMVLQWVDQAIADKSWLVITYHDIVNNGWLYTNTPAHIEAVLAWLDYRRSLWLLDVKTNKDAITDIKTQLP